MFTRHAYALVFLLLSSASAFAGVYTDLIVFGDSLSDVGNVKNNTFGTVPISPYFNGRFSNGLVYSELLAEGLGLGTLLPSTSGGNNYAHGGALTIGGSLFVDGVQEQVSDYVNSGSADPNALHVLLAGANDFFDGQTNAQVPANNIKNSLEQLYNTGAREFLVINLPLLGLTPEYNTNTSLAATMNARTITFNSTLASNLDSLESTLTDATFHRLDVAEIFTQIIASPQLFGLSNVTEPAASGLGATDLSYSGTVVSNPDEYLFWDEVHPTRVVHELLSQAALQAVSEPGDFNFDGQVDAADYDVWKAAFGTVNLGIDTNGNMLVDAAEYTVWRDHLTGSTGVDLAISVPEPTSVRVLIAGLLATMLSIRELPRRYRQSLASLV